MKISKIDPKPTIVVPLEFSLFRRFEKKNAQAGSRANDFDAVRLIAKASLIPAQLFDGLVPAMERKGRLQVGMDADITVFDSDTIIDRATIDKPA